MAAVRMERMVRLTSDDVARILPHDPVYCTRDSEDIALQKPMPWDSMMWATTTTRGNTAPFRMCLVRN